MYFLSILVNSIAFFLGVLCLLGFHLCRFLLLDFPGLHYLKHIKAHKHKEKGEENYLLHLQIPIIHTKKKKRKKINGQVNQSSIYINTNLKTFICKSQNALSRTTAKSFRPGGSQAKMPVWAGSTL